MRTDQNRLDRVVRSGGSALRVRCRPLGADLRDLTDHESVRWIQWLSAIPGLLGLLGFVLHHTRYRGRWQVLAEPASGDRGLRLDGLPRDRAVETYESLLDWLEAGNALAGFPGRPAADPSVS